MDAIQLTDHAGNIKNVRVEGIGLDINQSMKPSQRINIDTSLLPANVIIDMVDGSSDDDL
jgi:hypothetical protein